MRDMQNKDAKSLAGRSFEVQEEVQTDFDGTFPTEPNTLNWQGIANQKTRINLHCVAALFKIPSVVYTDYSLQITYVHMPSISLESGVGKASGRETRRHEIGQGKGFPDWRRDLFMTALRAARLDPGLSGCFFQCRRRASRLRMYSRHNNGRNICTMH